ncbi:MAG: calcium/sodium antiporter [Parcubacteria group bacterium]|nr:calcium/sodium antiporter [Parcubacteria group bacterium]
MVITYTLFFLGFALLIKGADFLVDGAASIAKKFGISTLVIGLTIVAFGTSAPELMVNILASLSGRNDIAIGNILGSNIANILLILGISAIIYPLAVQKQITWRDVPLSLLAAIAIGVLANDALIDKMPLSLLSRIDGIILLLFFSIFMYYIFQVSKSTSQAQQQEEVKMYSTAWALLMVVIGLVALTVGARWIVDGATIIARAIGLSELFIGLTIIAVGTSLPELATSAVAAYKHNVDIAVGNIVGSNIFNIFWILGVSAAINPIPFSPLANADVLMTIIVTLMLFFAMFVGKKHVLERWQGAGFVLVYIAYVAYLIYRG